ncbi:MAG: prepilin-type N-terminal cleavage/methylation domain-containing protein [Rhodospirillaceae bacterium]|nr:prepilin-type N-terminal cleavage/methylation domain-containing protein [Rhodospirillaceae bacterium]
MTRPTHDSQGVMNDNGEREAGFSLVEVLVALAVAALIVSVLFEALSGAFRADGKSSGAVAAALTARSLLDEFGVSRPLSVGVQEGQLSDHATWKAKVSVLPSRTKSLQAYEIHLTVTRDGETVTLETVRLVPGTAG